MIAGMLPVGLAEAIITSKAFWILVVVIIGLAVLIFGSE